MHFDRTHPAHGLPSPHLPVADRGIGPVPFAVVAGNTGPARREENAVPPSELAALAAEWTALRRLCVDSLRRPCETDPYALSLAEREALEAGFARLRTANARAWHDVRSPAIAAWPDPVLPRTCLWGARDLVRVLDVAIRAALRFDAVASNRR